MEFGVKILKKQNVISMRMGKILFSFTRNAFYSHAAAMQPQLAAVS